MKSSESTRALGSRPPDQPLVSVVVAFADTPVAFFKEALESVFTQTLRSWELLLVDDGAGKRRRAVAAEYARRDSARVRLLAHPGGGSRGLSASRNVALCEARGEFAAFLDADDVWLPSKLEEQIALLRAHPGVGMLYGNTLYWHSWREDEQGAGSDFLPSLGSHAGVPRPPPGPLPSFLRGRAAVPCTCSVLVERRLALAVGGFDPSFTGLYEDQVFYAKACLEAPVLAVDTCWDRYRQHGGSLTARSTADQQRAARARFLDWLETHARRRGALGSDLEAAIRSERRKLRYPRLARGARLARKLLRRMRS